jgi:hypothetical protein
MRIFSKKPDGGENSGVTAYFLFEFKSLFSIALLKFNKGSRDNFHTHAFNAVTWWLSGAVTEMTVGGGEKVFNPSFKPKFTSRDCFHKILAHKKSWALTFRGPWDTTWLEYDPNTKDLYILTDGRKILQKTHMG